MPDPEPVFVTVSGNVLCVKLAVTLCAEFMVIMQEPVPAHAPLQPVKVEPGSAVAVTVTVVPLGKFVLQVAPQLIPAGELVTVPEPLPDFKIVSA